MNATMTPRQLERENSRFQGSGGVSAENHEVGFRPAFLDTRTLVIYPSCFGDGRPAPFHLLDGLPDELVLARHACGRVAQVRATVVSGFVRGGRFFTREEAAAAVAELHH
jgi:hypothetical protein